MNSMTNLSAFLVGSLCLYLIIALIKFLHKYWWTPLRIQHIMSLQGIKGPSYKFIHGNNKETVKMKQEALSKPMATLSHDIFPRVHPHIYSRINMYGKNYLSWGGTMPQLFIIEPELVKELLRSSERDFPKRTRRERKKNEDGFILKILGDGLVTSEGEKWAKQRKLANHAFHGESLKSMTPAMIASVETMLERWKQYEGKEIEVFEEFRLLTSEVISRTAFGSSYLDGKMIFDMLQKLSVLTSRNMFKTKFPVISKLWKTADEIESDRLVKGIHNSVMEIVKKREEKVNRGEANSFGTDFLGSLINGYHDADQRNRLCVQDLVDECKTFYFAGQETTNSLLAWTVLLLAIHQDWQEKARQEVIEVFGDQNPHSEGIGRLKIMTMIINETLRLYPPANNIGRKAENEVQLGKLILPPDMQVLVPVIALHHDPQLWGDDVNLFKPERFAEGVANATKHNAAAFIPFGLGPRSCVGMSFAITETKTALAMILQRYTISLSPTYSHSPFTLLMLQPQHGIQRKITDLEMNSMANLSALLAGSLCLGMIIAVIKVLHKYWWTPLRIQHLMSLQGIKGPPYKFIHGNNKETIKMKQQALSKPMATLSHDILPRVHPQISSRINLYGKNYLSWGGTRPQLFITEPELVKVLMKSSERDFPKRTSRERKKNEDEFVFKILGDGLVTSEGVKRAKQRKLANHAFHGESLKNMTPAMIASVETMLGRWKQYEGKEIEVFEEFRLLTSEVISRTAFGSSYIDGKRIFDMLQKLSVLTNRNMFKARFPVISKFWKTADEVESDNLVKGIHNSVMEIVKKREEKVARGEANSFGTDFLGSLINGYHDADQKNRLCVRDLVDECKTFYFAGQETTNSLLSWTVLILAIHQDWQEKARQEVIEIFGNRNPHSEGIGRLKIMSMIIYETLRLYPPVQTLGRKVENEVQLGKLILPPDMHLVVPILALHHDPQLWGDDVNLFKPERFADGIANATKYNAAAFIPFGLGPRSCVGMSFAITETKTALAMILQRYSISLSPTYTHSPFFLLMLQPQHGIQVMLHSL
ncbi:hypothetical protein PTKIN_Ptkin02bG0026900 [Pterospermum kingtungense]